MKVMLSILLVFCFFTAVTQQKKITPAESRDNTNDTLHWSKDRKLTWDDFQGVPDSTSPGGAGTSSGFVTKSRYTSDSTISVTITAVFYKTKSWQKTQYQTIRSLKHEQGHFDITEVYAKKATAAFKKYKYNKVTVKKDIDSIVSFYFKEMSKADDLYDEETSYHRNLTKQKEWDNKIAAWLKKYSAL